MPWVFKTEPAECSIDDIAAAGQHGVLWEGVRNYQARNFLRDQVQVGDQVVIHHSSCEQVGVVGLAQVIETHLVDPSQFDGQSLYFDAKADPNNPRWVAVRVRHIRSFPHTLSLATLRQYPPLAEMQLLKKGNRLSIMPLTDNELEFILALSPQ